MVSTLPCRCTNKCPCKNTFQRVASENEFLEHCLVRPGLLEICFLGTDAQFMLNCVIVTAYLHVVSKVILNDLLDVIMIATKKLDWRCIQ